MKKKKIKDAIASVMFVGCFGSPVALAFLISNRHLYVDAGSASMGWIVLPFYFLPIIMTAAFKDGITEENLFPLLVGVMAFFVGVFCAIVSPWYILISLFAVAFMFLVID